MHVITYPMMITGAFFKANASSIIAGKSFYIYMGKGMS